MSETGYQSAEDVERLLNEKFSSVRVNEPSINLLQDVLTKLEDFTNLPEGEKVTRLAEMEREDTEGRIKKVLDMRRYKATASEDLADIIQDISVGLMTLGALSGSGSKADIGGRIVEIMFTYGLMFAQEHPDLAAIYTDQNTKNKFHGIIRADAKRTGENAKELWERVGGVPTNTKE